MTVSGELCCVALPFCCVVVVASPFLLSISWIDCSGIPCTCIYMYMYMYMYIYQSLTCHVGYCSCLMANISCHHLTGVCTIFCVLLSWSSCVGGFLPRDQRQPDTKYLNDKLIIACHVFISLAILVALGLLVFNLAMIWKPWVTSVTLTSHVETLCSVHTYTCTCTCTYPYVWFDKRSVKTCIYLWIWFLLKVL